MKGGEECLRKHFAGKSRLGLGGWARACRLSSSTGFLRPAMPDDARPPVLQRPRGKPPQKFAAFFLHKWTSAALPKPVEREAQRIHVRRGRAWVGSRQSRLHPAILPWAWVGSWQLRLARGAPAPGTSCLSARQGGGLRLSLPRPPLRMARMHAPAQESQGRVSRLIGSQPSNPAVLALHCLRFRPGSPPSTRRGGSLPSLQGGRPAAGPARPHAQRQAPQLPARCAAARPPLPSRGLRPAPAAVRAVASPRCCAALLLTAPGSSGPEAQLGLVRTELCHLCGCTHPAPLSLLLQAGEPSVRPLHEVLGSDTPKLQVQHSGSLQPLERSVSAASSSAG